MTSRILEMRRGHRRMKRWRRTFPHSSLLRPRCLHPRVPRRRPMVHSRSRICCWSSTSKKDSFVIGRFSIRITSSKRIESSVGTSNSKEVTKMLRVALGDNRPPNLFLYGPSGTGKSLITKAVCKNISAICESRDIRFGTIEVNCQDLDTLGVAVYESSANRAADEALVEVEVPKHGVATKEKVGRTVSDRQRELRFGGVRPRRTRYARRSTETNRSRRSPASSINCLEPAQITNSLRTSQSSRSLTIRR